jgi:hypothetical protein
MSALKAANFFPNKSIIMAKEFNFPDDEERLKAENDFLKMKLMLERGAFFGEQNEELPADVENQFLNGVMAFEKQFEQRKTIRLFEKIGRPRHFKPVGDIPDNEIENAYNSLLDYLHEHSIDLSVCSPNITARELYRFVTEELYGYEMDDIDLPGWTTNFIYDEFHPDPVYDNTRAATEDCIYYILQKEPMKWTHHFKNENLQLNEHHGLMIEELKNMVNRFKMAYDNLEINDIKAIKCIVNEKESWVEGNYSISATSGNNAYPLSGDWKVVFEKDEEFDYWYINSVAVKGINF